MKRKITLILGMTASLIFIVTGLTFSQEQNQPGQAGVTPEMQSEPEMQWAWGEVVSVDTQRNELTVKYLDYETDQEKQMVLNVDEKTTYENIKSLNEIKTLDTAGIDYIITPEGRNIARNVSIENPENIKPEGKSIESTTPVTPAEPAQAQGEGTSVPAQEMSQEKAEESPRPAE